MEEGATGATHLSIISNWWDSTKSSVNSSWFFDLSPYMSASTIDHIRMMDELITDLFPRSLTVPTVLIVCCFGTVLLLRKLFSSFVHAAFERELSKAVNASKVTVGSCSIALFTGLFEAKNIVVHTPDRYAWQWDSPLIGRCGYMKVNFSLLSCLPFQRLLRYPAKEIYSVLLCDMQAFVEKRSNVSAVRAGDLCGLVDTFLSSLDSRSYCALPSQRRRCFVGIQLHVA